MTTQHDANAIVNRLERTRIENQSTIAKLALARDRALNEIVAQHGRNNRLREQRDALAAALREIAFFASDSDPAAGPEGYKANELAKRARAALAEVEG